jgi:Domain of unknown function (DUF6268)
MRPFITTILASQLLAAVAFAQNPNKVNKKMPLCNPLVIGQIPKKALSLHYDYQTSFTNDFVEQYATNSAVQRTNKVNNVQAVRANFNKNLIVKPKLYMSMDIGYWYSRFAAEPSNPATVFANQINGAEFHSFTATANIFKPLSNRHFLLVYLSAELNGNGRAFTKLGAQNLFGGGGVLYGWKKGLNSMKAIGLLRAYRLGRVVHVPAFLMNHNFNKKWGLEMLLPARATFRYAPNAKSFILLGYDLEGGQFAFAAPGSPMDNSFFQRGEIRPRLGYEGSLSKNCRFTVNAGLRINGRFVFADNYDGKNLLVDNLPTSSLFANVGLHIVNLKGMGKKKQ